MQLPAATIEQVLGAVRGLADWVPAWNRAAHEFLAEARREDGAGHWREAAEARRNAAMSYHVAHLITDTDPRTVRALRAAGTQAFSQAVPRLMPGTRKVGITWRASTLAAYLAKPRDGHPNAPVAVILNGATTTKEETILWSRAFLEQGIAVLAVDWPGTGEAADGNPLSSQCDDITDGVCSFVESEPEVDSSRLALVGFSLGGAVAVRAAALDRRVGACVTVTTPYDARPWVAAVNPIVRQQLLTLAGDSNSLDELVADFALPGVVARLRCPLLVFGAGRDLVVPPEESLNLCAAVGELATLVWYPQGSHGLYDYVEDWTSVAALWLRELFGAPASQSAQSTQVDAPSTMETADDSPAAGANGG